MIPSGLFLLFLVWLCDGFKKWSTRSHQAQLFVAYTYIASLVLMVAGCLHFFWTLI